MNTRSPLEGLARQFRAAVEARRSHEDGRVSQKVADVLTVLEAAERAGLRTGAIDLEAHDKLRQLLGSIGEEPSRKKKRNGPAEPKTLDEKARQLPSFGDG